MIVSVFVYIINVNLIFFFNPIALHNFQLNVLPLPHTYLVTSNVNELPL